MIYVFLNDNLYRVEKGIAKKQSYVEGGINALRQRSKLIHAIPIVRKRFDDSLKIYVEKSEYIYYYLLRTKQKALISAKDMRRIFGGAKIPFEHRALVGKNLFVVEDNI